MFWFIMIPLIVLICLSFVVMILIDKTKNGGNMPRIHYKRDFESGAKYLLKICPVSSKTPNDRLEILGELSYDNERFFLLQDCKGSFYLRKYQRRSGEDGITRYILKDLTGKEAKKLKKQDSFDRLCLDSIGRSAAKININAWDNVDMKVLINTYPIEESIKDPVKAAFELEKKSVEAFLADNAKDAEENVPFIKKYNVSPPKWSTPNIDAEANWQECKRQTDYSLYVTYDWDIFKDEK